MNNVTLSNVEMGFSTILTSQEKTYSVLPDNKNHKTVRHLVYLKDFTKDSNRVLVGSVSLLNAESYQKANTIIGGKFVATIEKTSLGIILGVHKDMATELPKGLVELVLDCGKGKNISLGHINGVQSYDGPSVIKNEILQNNGDTRSYNYFAKVYREYMEQVVKKAFEEAKAKKT